MMPSIKLETKGAEIVQRMKDRTPVGFTPLADRLNAVVGEGSWADVVVR